MVALPALDGQNLISLVTMARQNELTNRCFKGSDDIVDECSWAWNCFITAPPE